MEYNKFIQSAFDKIKTIRQTAFNQLIINQAPQLQQEPENVYIELIAYKNSDCVKIQEWSFITLKDLAESQYGESYDSQLDSVEVQKKSFFITLEETLQQFSCKIPLKLIQPEKLCLRLRIDKKQLLPFPEQSNYVIDVAEYEGLNFCTRVSLKLLQHENNPSSSDIDELNEEEEFQVLIDPQFEKQREQQLKREQCKFSTIREQMSPLSPYPRSSISLKRESIRSVKKQEQQGQAIRTSTKYIECSYNQQKEKENQREYFKQEIKQLTEKLNLESISIKQLFDQL